MANKKRKKRPPAQGQARPKKPVAKPAVADAPAASVAKAKATPAKATPAKATPAKGKATVTPPRPSTARKKRSATRQWLVLGAAAVVIIGVVIFLSVRETLDPGGTGVTDAAAWDLPALDDELDDNGDGRVALAEFAGTPTVVNFFASWCVACETELPGFVNVASRLRDEVDFVFVNSNETGNWRPMAERANIEQFPLIKDIAGTNRNGLYRSLGGTGGMPITAFYDAQGRLVDTVRQPLSESQITERLTANNLL